MKYHGDILTTGIGSRKRWAALRPVLTRKVAEAHGNSEVGKFLAGMLAEADAALAGNAVKAEGEGEAGDVPAAPAPRKARKPRKADAAPDALGKVEQKQCVACRKPFRNGGTNHGSDGWTCDACDAEAAE